MDIVLLILVVVTTVMGGYWGFLRQGLALAGLLAGLAAAAVYGRPVADALSSWSQDLAATRAGGLLLVALAVSVPVSLLASLLQRYAGLRMGGRPDQLLGGLLGLLQGVLGCAALMIIGGAFASPSWSATLQTSRVAPLLVWIGSSLLGWLLPGSWIQAALVFFGMR